MEIDWNSLLATWYSWLGSLNSWMQDPIRSLSSDLGIPLVSAFLFGLLGTTAPCQISTNMGAMAFLARRPSDRTATVRATLAYVAAKVLAYTVIGLVVLVAGRQILNAVGPYIEWPRKLVGPLMIVLGLVVGGAIRVPVQLGQQLGSRLERRAMARSGERNYAPATATVEISLPAAIALSTAGVGVAGDAGFSGSSSSVQATRASSRVPMSANVQGENAAPGVWSSFLLGLGFSLAFCPTLFILFFGATLTLAARSTEGFTFPAVFALGTVVPLVLFVGLALTGSRAAERLRRGMRKANKPLRWVAAALLIVLGLHDTLVYWFL